ncbi:MAG: hypothetical protein ACYC7A_14605 [Thermoanaerobaculia bacterium]
MIAAPLILAAVLQVTRTPPAPTIGDTVSIAFPADVREVTFDDRDGLEIVSRNGNRAVVRIFRVGPMRLQGCLTHADGRRVRFHSLEIPVHSVLKAGDSEEPSPLAPPLPLPDDRRPWIAVACAAGAALLAWTALLLLKRRRPATILSTSPGDELLAALEAAARLADRDARLIAAADAVRRFLDGVGAAPRALTSGELATVLREHGVAGRPVEIVEQLLRAADAAKFSPWGSEVEDDRAIMSEAGAIREAFAPRAGGEA